MTFMNRTRLAALSAGLFFAGCIPDDGRPDYITFEQTILELAGGQADLTQWVELVQISGLDEALGGTQASFTVLAPSDDAFAAFPAAELEALKNDPIALSKLLRFHMVPGIQKLNLLRLNDVVPTLTSTTIRVTDAGEVVTLSDASGTTARLISVDVQGSNGVLHTIDAVLTPPVPPVLP